VAEAEAAWIDISGTYDLTGIDACSSVHLRHHFVASVAWRAKSAMGHEPGVGLTSGLNPGSGRSELGIQMNPVFGVGETRTML
jgi:hypothetical protein